MADGFPQRTETAPANRLLNEVSSGYVPDVAKDQGVSDIFISGVPFLALGHRDGRFFRGPGLFAFARREPSGLYTVLHLELAEAVNRTACPHHPRWRWAVAEGLDTLLLHLFGGPAEIPVGSDASLETVLWHPEAQAVLLIEDGALQQPGQPPVRQAGLRP